MLSGCRSSRSLDDKDEIDSAFQRWERWFAEIEESHLTYPDDPISITRADFDEAWDRLAAIGIELKADQDQAWRDFAGWRVNYDTVLLALADVTVAAYAPWTSDRSAPSHKRPQVRRFGSRRTQQFDPDSQGTDRP